MADGSDDKEDEVDKVEAVDELKGEKEQEISVLLILEL